ncbi:succinate dehydrogenase cytochrome b-556 subunit [Oryzomicrobium terrae]|uniref:Succinate dehydrogenase cytochrome b556 subunit n=1 Tax=Oryzomicrobium terrae TaxID=1735038 RepID=A0A5C1E7L6_9RHOO|nr:succinate dehydrogenase, cytochrome b556 subunit [Oryzomicrobium terrae]QEL64920.1 succinate dehydrogenase cytochrome b-556 subunit [Oryzomicrobium terrae]
MAELTMKKKRPKNLDLLSIKQPLPAVLSILHRVSGAGLFLFLPVLLWLFQSSLASPDSFAMVKGLAGNIVVKVVLLGLLWAYCHHFCAGIRYLLLDGHIGIEKEAARMTSKISFAVSLVATAILGGALLW